MCHYTPVSSAYHPVPNPTFPSNLLGNVSAITDVCFWKAAAHKWTHLLFMSYQSTRFSQPSPTQGTLLRLVCHRATYHIDACWLNVGADGARRTCHDPPDILVFSRGFFLPRGAEQHGVESRPSLAAIYLCSCVYLASNVISCTWQNVPSILPCFNDRDKETQIALLFVYYNTTERAVIHYFYFWIISFTRDLMNKSSILPPGEHFPSCWHLCGSKATSQPTTSDSFETDVMTTNSSMVPHSQRMVSESSEWNEHVKFVCFLCLILCVGGCMMVWCGWLTGFTGPGWSHNTLE